MGDLQQAANYHDVLQKMDHLTLVAEFIVKEDGGGEHGNDRHGDYSPLRSHQVPV
jgi:hypothetical protein